MRLKRKTKRSRPAHPCAALGVALAVASLLAGPRGPASPAELRLGSALTASARADLEALSPAAGLTLTDAGGVLRIRLGRDGALPAELLDWARRCGVPLPRPADTVVAAAEAVCCAKDSPVGASTAGPAMPGPVGQSARPAPLPIARIVDHPRHRPVVLAEHRAGRSPPTA